jgi:hypothetical protein
MHVQDIRDFSLYPYLSSQMEKKGAKIVTMDQVEFAGSG